MRQLHWVSRIGRRVRGAVGFFDGVGVGVGGSQSVKVLAFGFILYLRGFVKFLFMDAWDFRLHLVWVVMNGCIVW
jgi:hypothetical protein